MRGKHRRTKPRPHDSGVTKTGGYSAPPTPSGPLPKVPPGPAPGETRKPQPMRPDPRRR